MQIFKRVEDKLPKSVLFAKIVLLAALFCASAIFLFYNAYKYSFPIAFAGMYTQMAEQIANNGFSIPMRVPYYGPGGLPFAYPPLALYMMAIFLKFDVSMITYTRFMPPIFSLLALIPLYLLTRDLTDSDLAAGFAAGYAAFSPLLYASHTWAAGIVRAPAFFFMLSGFYFFNKMVKEGKIQFALLAGIFGGLTTLTHLYYALSFAIWSVCWAAASWKKIQWKSFLTIPIVAGAVAAPWLLTVISRYGMGTLLNTFKSHDNAAFMELIPYPRLFIAWAAEHYINFSATPLSLIFIIIGLVYLIINRQFGLPLTLLSVVLTQPTEGPSFSVLLGAFLFGISSQIFKGRIVSISWNSLAVVGIFGITLAQLAVYGFDQIKMMPPTLHESAFEVARYVKEKTPPEARYLFVAGQSEAEWFPYLLQREPFVSKWGSEWLGTYDEQRNLQSQVIYCKDLQSVECLKQLNLEIMPADILITRKAEKDLSNELASFSACKKLASIGRYIIWQAQCLKQ